LKFDLSFSQRRTSDLDFCDLIQYFQASMLRRIAVARYDHAVDLSGADMISFAGKSREEFKRLFPSLLSPPQMSRRFKLSSGLRAINGEIADELHEFNNVTWCDSKLLRILLKQGRVIGMEFQADDPTQLGKDP
jgi:hypothetical protein